jgi:hypothetical protein
MMPSMTEAQPTATTSRWGRDVVALVLLAVACPAALFGGSMLGCIGQGFDASCAMDAIFVSPIVLLGAGVVSGLLLRGWTGVFLMVGGVIIGMFLVMFVAFGLGRPVPIDPISGVIATMWFLAPVAVGYFIGRILWHLWQRLPGDDRTA